MMIVCHESICTGNYLYRFVYILEVVCQWLKVHTLPCYSRDLCSNYERDNSASNATNQPIILISLQPDLKCYKAFYCVVMLIHWSSRSFDYRPRSLTYSTLSLVMILVYAMSTHDAYGTYYRLKCIRYIWHPSRYHDSCYRTLMRVRSDGNQ